ncbi:sensor histidine kinase [Paenibacillus radicis (ex Gao et al. 2016)]|uniref:histidine kinase n=1 Tax=Paenibacillus radicis (ex Gao et al. 2016) TaxID=1737354 RepID=A0A917H4T4_9BACL|nr:HAMP domain-containing sensor histidine kinase [Paenibacillus radicis (ex Gao et al. 2016)]GGG67415.1 two-component sensor histidine kinase [Paenibacillus radicis (ex Gao et al. 2016)]
MVTKWRNRLGIGVWSVLFAFGLSGLFIVSSFGSNYVQRDYFHTEQFRNELDRFAQYLNMYELNLIPLEEAKQLITVSEDEIIDYRHRLGDITQLITSLNSDYESRIDEARAGNNQEAADILIAERDKKIEDIKKVFTSDEYARTKAISEKEKELEAWYKGGEEGYQDYLRLKGQFQYYFKSTVSDEVYSNLNMTGNESINDQLSAKNMRYITSYSIPIESSRNYYSLRYAQLENANVLFQGQIAVARALPPSSSVAIKYDNYHREQIALWAYTFASIVALILSFIFIRRTKEIPARIGRWAPHYNKLPIDVRLVFIALTGLGAIILLFMVKDEFHYLFENPFVSGWNMIINLTMASICVVATLIQTNFTAAQLKDGPSVKTEWEKGLLIKKGQRIKAGYQQIKRSLSDSFLNKSMGVQLFALLIVLFALGLAVLPIVITPVYFLVYVILLAIIGIPTVMILVNRVGYFNRIVIKTKELAAGSSGQDLLVSGNSVLATLAGNINILNDGVRTLQNEQAKSERLKTELITNVSHDLRTPLTSIITYTELLKKEEVSNEDRAAYIDIIDQKSQRLKVLIDDLFEVSKMASGNVELNKEKVDLIQLLQQTLAEYDDAINDSSLQFRLPNMEEPVYAFVDGQKLFRVFDNLIGNILKYSLAHSRVYITVQTVGNQVIVAFKNVSKYEISENIDELFERFKRGDSSRHTEGSGLGLAIAKSIVDLHEGLLNIEVDGDLFKVSISLRVSE